MAACMMSLAARFVRNISIDARYRPNFTTANITIKFKSTAEMEKICTCKLESISEYKNINFHAEYDKFYVVLAGMETMT